MRGKNFRKNRKLFVISTIIVCILLLATSVNGESLKTIPISNTTSTKTETNQTSTTEYYNQTYSANSDFQQQTTSVLKNDANLNLSSYNTQFGGQETSTYQGFSRTTVTYLLSSPNHDSSLRVACSFIGDELQKLYISDIDGALCLNKESSN